jgi:hypothetical protein
VGLIAAMGQAGEQPSWMLMTGLFFITLAVVRAAIGDHFSLSIDEGIYLAGAERAAQGQAPYRDFFLLTGPGTFWLYDVVFRLFGPSLSKARLVVAGEIGFLTTAGFWLLRRLTGRALFSLAAAVLFAGFLLATPARLVANHRWDSNTLAIAAIVLIAAGMPKRSRVLLVLAGMCAAAAAWVTPPFLIVVATLGAWMLWREESRRHAAFYALGVVLPSLLAVAVLTKQHAFGPMVHHLLWAGANYSQANRVMYGAVLLRDPEMFFGGKEGVELVSPALRLVAAAVPSILPLAAYGGLGLLWWRRKRNVVQSPRSKVQGPARTELYATFRLVLVASAALLAAAYPRLGAAQLLYLTPVFWVLCAYVLHESLRERWRTPCAVVLGLLACALLIGASTATLPRSIATRVGDVRCSTRHHALLSALQAKIKPGDTLFVHPYLPILYFVTGGVNPTRYSFLQPGMMTGQDEANAVAEIKARPPRWIVWHDFSPELILANWPNSDPKRLHFRAVEDFILINYHVVDGGADRGYRLFEHDQP